ncbi:MAG TPA: hypothetical protein VHP83_23130 [Aggregatilineaceae bacterium]|nr:hypothetical protein [Aggregatilineaceae bacterium]
MTSRWLATGMVWFLVSIILAIVLTSSTGPAASSSGTAIALTVILAGAAVMATSSIWGQYEQRLGEKTSFSKGKRVEQNRVQRLIQDLSDDEIYELEATLLAQENRHNHNRS